MTEHQLKTINGPNFILAAILVWTFTKHV